MFHFKAEELSIKQQYKFVIGSVVPRPIAWVTTLSKDTSIVNAAPYSFFSGASDELPILTIAVLRKNGKIKDTAQNILDLKEAVIHIVDQKNGEAMNATCTFLPADVSELSLIDVSLEDSHVIKVPRIKETKIQFETILKEYVPIKNEQGEIITDFFMLQIVAYHIDNKVFDEESGYILSQELDPIARLAGNQYVELGKEFSMLRPD